METFDTKELLADLIEELANEGYEARVAETIPPRSRSVEVGLWDTTSPSAAADAADQMIEQLPDPPYPLLLHLEEVPSDPRLPRCHISWAEAKN